MMVIVIIPGTNKKRSAPAVGVAGTRGVETTKKTV